MLALDVTAIIILVIVNYKADARVDVARSIKYLRLK